MVELFWREGVDKIERILARRFRRAKTERKMDEACRLLFAHIQRITTEEMRAEVEAERPSADVMQFIFR